MLMVTFLAIWITEPIINALDGLLIGERERRSNDEQKLSKLVFLFIHRRSVVLSERKS